MEGVGKHPLTGLTECTVGQPKWRVSGQELCKGQQHPWDARYQDFLTGLEHPRKASGNLLLMDSTPCNNIKAFLSSFEQIAEACRWPRDEWVPIPEVARSSLELDRPLPDSIQSVTYTDRKPKDDRDIGLLASGITFPSPPDQQETAETGLTEGPTSFKEIDLSFDKDEQTLVILGQRTMFWQVKEEISENAASLGNDLFCPCQ
uniref:Uncharacterized protein n=1 Tax=Sphaerodactylus townsendi TaxID=933632 RepID=A0ACB8EG46_9SAUR